MKFDVPDDFLEVVATKVAELVTARLGREDHHDDGVVEWRLLSVEETAAVLGRSERWVRARTKFERPRSPASCRT
jgi:hypothetical protein